MASFGEARRGRGAAAVGGVPGAGPREPAPRRQAPQVGRAAGIASMSYSRGWPCTVEAEAFAQENVDYSPRVSVI
jgi:hypothetical protein